MRLGLLSKDYVDGKILLFEVPPDVTDVEIAHEVTGSSLPLQLSAQMLVIPLKKQFNIFTSARGRVGR
jgi:hypothetical protein